MRKTFVYSKMGVLPFKEIGKITGFRVLSANPPIEEVTGEGSGRIGSMRTRTVWTHKSIIGKGLEDLLEGNGIIFAENGETISYTLKGTGKLLRNFGYRTYGTMKYRAHSRRSNGKLAFLHSRTGKFESITRADGKVLTKILIV